MQDVWNWQELSSIRRKRWIYLARNVLASEIKSRIDEQRGHGISINYIRIKELESQLKELEAI